MLILIELIKEDSDTQEKTIGEFTALSESFFPFALLTKHDGTSPKSIGYMARLTDFIKALAIRKSFTDPNIDDFTDKQGYIESLVNLENSRKKPEMSITTNRMWLESQRRCKELANTNEHLRGVLRIKQDRIDDLGKTKAAT